MHRMQSGDWPYSKVGRDSSKALSLRMTPIFVGELYALKSQVTVDHKLLSTYCKHRYHIHHMVD